MNTTQYIASGVLEAFVIGDLTEEEGREVEANLEKYQELRDALEKIEAAYEQVLAVGAIEPDPTLRERIFKVLDKKKSDELNQKTQGRRKMAGFSIVFGAAAAVVILVVFGYREMGRSIPAHAEKTRQTLSDANKTSKPGQYVIGNPEFLEIKLKGTEGHSDLFCAIYWNKRSGEIFLLPHHLDELADANQFQLWAIVEGKPVNAGVFDDQKGVLLKMPNIQVRPSAFAITIEPKGGSDTPTLATMQVIGNV